MKIIVVIPAYNEESKITQVIQELKTGNFQNIVVVDDGSADKTVENAKNEKVTVLEHIINRGQGAALKTGIDYALEENADIIVTFDADGQHRVEDVNRMIAPILNQECDISLGSRFLNKEQKTPFIRKLFLKGGTLIVNFMYGLKLTDSHNGLRALSRKAAEKIEIKSNKMEHASEILDEISRKKLKYKEIAITIKYTEYSKQKGQSTWNAFNILYKMVLQKLMK